MGLHGTIRHITCDGSANMGRLWAWDGSNMVPFCPFRIRLLLCICSYYTLLQAAHRTTDYMYTDTGVENSSLLYIYTSARYAGIATVPPALPPAEHQSMNNTVNRTATRALWHHRYHQHYQQSTGTRAPALPPEHYGTIATVPPALPAEHRHQSTSTATRAPEHQHYPPPHRAGPMGRTDESVQKGPRKDQERPASINIG